MLVSSMSIGKSARLDALARTVTQIDVLCGANLVWGSLNEGVMKDVGTVEFTNLGPLYGCVYKQPANTLLMAVQERCSDIHVGLKLRTSLVVDNLIHERLSILQTTQLRWRRLFTWDLLIGCSLFVWHNYLQFCYMPHRLGSHCDSYFVVCHNSSQIGILWNFEVSKLLQTFHAQSWDCPVRIAAFRISICMRTFSAVSYHTMLCHTTPCCVTPHHAVSHHTRLCHTTRCPSFAPGIQNNSSCRIGIQWQGSSKPSMHRAGTVKPFFSFLFYTACARQNDNCS